MEEKDPFADPPVNEHRGVRMERENAFCENAECRVVEFRCDDENQNCPDCGRFGRVKDEPKTN